MGVVVDANIGASSGTVSQAPQSKISREFLEYIKDQTNIHVLMCSKMRDEWSRNSSRFGKSWLVSMRSKGRISNVEIDTSSLDTRISRISGLSERQVADAQKDSHLVVLAVSDKIIFSIEINSKKIFEDNKTHIAEVKGLVWRSPVEEWDICIELCNPTCNLFKYAM